MLTSKCFVTIIPSYYYSAHLHRVSNAFTNAEKSRPYFGGLQHQAQFALNAALSIASSSTRSLLYFLVVSFADKTKLKAENRRLRAALVCRQCNCVKVETLFLPCRHLVACQRCADATDHCVKCGQKILGTVRTYLL